MKRNNSSKTHDYPLRKNRDPRSSSKYWRDRNRLFAVNLCAEGISKEKVAQFFGEDVTTIEEWIKETLSP